MRVVLVQEERKKGGVIVLLLLGKQKKATSFAEKILSRELISMSYHRKGKKNG